MTVKQCKAINKTVENGGNISKAMREAGYSPKTAKNPKKLTESKSWKELIDEHIPQELLLSSLHDDIVSKPGNRKTELELGFRITSKLNPKLIESESQVFFITRGLPVKKDGSDE